MVQASLARQNSCKNKESQQGKKLKVKNRPALNVVAN